MWSLNCFSGVGFSLAENHKQYSKGAGIQLRPNLIYLLKILLFIWSPSQISGLYWQPLLANNPLDTLMFTGKEQFNSCLRRLLVWKSDSEEHLPHQAPLIIKSCTFKINQSGSKLSEDKSCSASLFSFPSQLGSRHPSKFHRYLHIWNNMIFLVIVSWSPLWSKGRKGVRNYNLKTSRLAEWCCPQLKSNLKGKTLLLLRSAESHQLSQRKVFLEVHREHYHSKTSLTSLHWNTKWLIAISSIIRKKLCTLSFLCARLIFYWNFHFLTTKKIWNIVFKTFHNGFFSLPFLPLK